MALRHGISAFAICSLLGALLGGEVGAEAFAQKLHGNNVSHSKRRTKRVFDVNLFTKKFYWVEEDEWISLTISAAGLRLINKIGLDAAIKRAAANGYL